MPTKPTRIAFVCRRCGKPFTLLPGRVAQGRGVYCGPVCTYADRKRALAQPPNCVCAVCGKAFREKPSRIAAGKGRFCSRTCDNAWRAREPLWSRVWRRVNYGEPGCWPWTGHTDADGYGFFQFEKRTCRATREVWRLIHGTYPTLACHACDNPGCCRPSHLYDGTPQSNMDDMHRRGRARPVWGGLHGERSPAAKLAVEQIDAIRARYATGHVTQTALAREYGVTQSAISAITTRTTWKRTNTHH
jgi:hypothetical protein